MTPDEILQQLEADGISLRINDQGGLAYRGKKSRLSIWLPKIGAHKHELLQLLITQQIKSQGAGAAPARSAEPSGYQTDLLEPPPVTVNTTTSVGKYAVGLVVSDALLATYTPSRGVMVTFTLTQIDGHSSRRREGRLIEPSGMRSAVHCLHHTYGDRLESINGHPAAEVIMAVLGSAL